MVYITVSKVRYENDQMQIEVSQTILFIIPFASFAKPKSYMYEGAILKANRTRNNSSAKLIGQKSLANRTLSIRRRSMQADTADGIIQAYQ